MIEVSAHRVGQVLMVGAEAAVARAAAHLTQPPAEPGRTTVQVIGDDLRDWEQLAPTLAAHTSEVGTSVRLVSPPAMNPPSIASARRLGDQLGIEVVAPDGPLLPARDGSMFVLGPDASWWIIEAGAAARQVGPHHPTPWWAEHRPTTATDWVTIPAGGWLPGGERPDAAVPDDLVLAVPRHDSLFTMVVGAPDQPPVARETLLASVADLPAPVRERLLVVAYGPEQDDAAPALAATFGVRVYGADGLPGYGPAGEIVVRAVAADGRRGPRQCARTFAQAPEEAEGRPALRDEPSASPDEWPAGTSATDIAAEAPLPPVRVRPDQRSATPERHRLRGALGAYYDLHARVVARLLAQHPGLRVLPAGDEPHALMTDLVAVRAFLMGDRSSVTAALRSMSDVGDPAFLICLASGLRRLPSYHGVVYSSVPTEHASRVYPDGRSFWEPTFLEASTTRVAAGAEMTDLIVWSTNGRHVGGIVGGGDHHRVVFPARSRFVVLGHRPAGRDCSAAVFLRDVPAEPGQTEGTTNRRIHKRLEALTAAGARLGCQAASDPGWAVSGELPGCDETGRPYRSE
ncbi:hypothetical protein [Salinispora arenicola]|uniref:hypothetical protein n=1 Tax=Salinispora arenicola TaxID=168697 RepID=UPI000378ECF0|nr:hypothetical protein [Salinispora arenicola]